MALASLATTVIVFDPTFRLTCALQLAVLEPLAVPPLAELPLTVTEEMPLPPNPESLAVPETVTVLVDTVDPFVGPTIVRAGPVVSAGGFTVSDEVVLCVIEPVPVMVSVKVPVDVEVEV